MEQTKKLTGYVLVDPIDGGVLCSYSATDNNCTSVKMEAIHDADERKVYGIPMEVYACYDNEYSEETKVYPHFEVVPCGIGDVCNGRMWFCVKPNNPHEVVYFDTKQKCEQYIRKYHNSDPHLLKVLRNTHGRSIIYA